LDRLGLSGKLMAIGGLVGILATFLPLVSVSVEVGMVSVSQKVAVAENWRGKVCLAGYVAALVLVFVLYPPNGLAQKALAWAGFVVGLVIAVLAVWLLVLAMDSGGTSMMGMGSARASAGIGAFLNVLTAAAVAAGGFLKAREEKLI
jgi:hypothetical protein